MSRLTLAAEGLESLFGARDQNLKRLEQAFEIRVSARGGEVMLDGDPERVAQVEHLLKDLSALAAEGHRIRQQDIVTAIRVVQQDSSISLPDFFRPTDPTLASAFRMVQPRSLNQRIYLQAMLEHDMIFATGPAGTGKTFLAVAMAAAALLEKRVRRIVLARPAVEAGEKLGFLPGDLAEKVNPYLRPIYDSLHDLLGYDKVSRMLERGIIEVAPIAFMRGRTLNESFVILDEAQNTTPEQMKMFLTRIGFGSKAVINGDITQIDLPEGRPCGLRQAHRILHGVSGIAFMALEKQDVVRHPLVQRIVSAYDQWDEEHPRATPERRGRGREQPDA